MSGKSMTVANIVCKMNALLLKPMISVVIICKIGQLLDILTCVVSACCVNCFD